METDTVTTMDAIMIDNDRIQTENVTEIGNVIRGKALQWCPSVIQNVHISCHTMAHIDIQSGATDANPLTTGGEQMMEDTGIEVQEDIQGNDIDTKEDGGRMSMTVNQILRTEQRGVEEDKGIAVVYRQDCLKECPNDGDMTRPAVPLILLSDIENDDTFVAGWRLSFVSLRLHFS